MKLRIYFLNAVSLTALLLSIHLPVNNKASRSLSSTITAPESAVRSSNNSGEVFQLETKQQDGIPVRLRVGKCSNTPQYSCLFFRGNAEAEKEIGLGPHLIHAIEIGLMGKHFGGVFETVYVYFYKDPPNSAGGDLKSAIVVIDPNQAKQVAWVSNASLKGFSLYNSYFSLVRAPGKSFPFQAPGQHYLNKEQWDFLCIFDPNRIANPDTNCGTGFRSVSTAFKSNRGKSHVEESGFRHNRGWLLDIDSDGWDDIHLPFFKYVLSISGRTGEHLSLSQFDVAKFSEPQAVPFFHSGRLYGSFTNFTDPSSQEKMTLILAGSTVGNFADWNCSVSRYSAALRWKINPWPFGAPRPYAQLAWSDYASFSNTVFTHDTRSIHDILRSGDGIYRCLHRFSDSLLQISGKPAVAFSQFETPERPDCNALIFEAQKNGFRQEDIQRTAACMDGQIKSIKGTWNIYVKDAVSGKNIGTLPHSYLWGRVENFWPGQGPLFLVENFSGDGKVRFDQAGHLPHSFSFVSIVKEASWSVVDILKSPGAAPRIDLHECYASDRPGRGNAPGGNCGVPEFETKDIDGDGLNDIQLVAKEGKSAKWIGYSAKANKVVLKE
jgi:hypothetical protein